MKSPTYLVGVVLFALVFTMSLWGEIYFSKMALFWALVVLGGINSLAISWDWYSPIFKSRSGADCLEKLECNTRGYPELVRKFMPKFSSTNNPGSARDINESIGRLWLSGVHFGVAVLGLGAQAVLWLGDLSSLTSGIYGAPLRFSLGRALFSMFSYSFFALGLSVLLVGVLARAFSWRFK